MAEGLYLYRLLFARAANFRQFRTILRSMPEIMWRLKISAQHNKAHGHVRLIDRFDKGCWISDDQMTLAIAVKIVHYSDWYRVPAGLMHQLTVDYRTISDETAKALVKDSLIVSRPSDGKLHPHPSKQFLLVPQPRYG